MKLRFCSSSWYENSVGWDGMGWDGMSGVIGIRCEWGRSDGVGMLLWKKTLICMKIYGSMSWYEQNFKFVWKTQWDENVDGMGWDGMDVNGEGAMEYEH